MEWQPRDTSPPIGTALLVTVGDADAADVAVRAGADLLDVGPATPAAAGAIRGRHPGVGLAVRWRSPGRPGHPAPALPTGTRLICDDVTAAEAALAAGAPREAILVAAPPERAQAVAAAGWAVVAEVDQAGHGPGRPSAPGQITPAQQIGNRAQAVTVSDENNAPHPADDAAPAAREADHQTSPLEAAVPGAANRNAPAPAGPGGPVEGATPSAASEEPPAVVHPMSRAQSAPDADAGEVSAVVAAAAICGWLGVAAVRTRHVSRVRRALDMTASIRGIRPPAWTIRALA